MTEISIDPMLVPQWDGEHVVTQKRGRNDARTGGYIAPEAAFAGISLPGAGEGSAVGMQATRTPYADIHIVDLRPNGGILPPEDAVFGPPIRTITIKILVAAPAAGSDRPTAIRLAFMPLHPLPMHIIPPPARLRIRLSAANRQKLQDSTLGRTISGDHIEIPELLGSIGGITLAPGEILPIPLEYETDYLDEGSALRVLQYAGEPDCERLTGVQIYVFTGMSR